VKFDLGAVEFRGDVRNIVIDAAQPVGKVVIAGAVGCGAERVQIALQANMGVF
jgi:hypothetical protein